MTHDDDRVGDELRRSAERLAIPAPDLDRIQARGRGRRSRRRIEVIGLAFVVALVGIGLPIALVTHDSSDTAAHTYYIHFPAAPTNVTDGSGRQGARFVATTNLPDGTRVSLSGPEGSCCPQAEHGKIAIDTYGNESCYHLVGNAGNAPPYPVTITVQPVFNFGFPGPGPSAPPKQPESVLEALGKHFERMRGPQVHHTKDGNVLVASTTYSWPSPQCGGPLPLFGGPTCSYKEGNSQLQGGDTLAEAMPDVMGAIAQARMCEFWQADLTPTAQASITWPAFAAQWRQWYLDPPKRFGPPNSEGWEGAGLAWHVVSRRGHRYDVLVTYRGHPLLRLQLVPLPNYCPGCGANVVPFWGVASWRFL